MKRRQFLQSASLASIPAFINGFSVNTIARSKLFDGLDTNNDKVLVLIQCNGGYDGLNMVLPMDQYGGLSQVRSNILIPESQALLLEDKVGLHPSLQGMSNLFQSDSLAIVQSVGYPNQNRSHFRSKDIWISGSAADEFLSTGWMGRYLDDQFPEYPDGYPNQEFVDPFAITIGSAVSETCQGLAANFSMAINDPFNLIPLTVSAGGEVPNTYYGHQLSFLRDAIIKSNEYAEVVTAAAEKGGNQMEYPDTALANQLKTVALLLAGGLQTKVFVVNIGGFDTHANQTNNGDSTTGVHANLLSQLGGAVEAFQNDLVAMGLDQRVLTVNFTEFGRRIKSNGSLGTDHGSAAPLFVVGSCVNAAIFGENVSIPNEVGNQDGVPMQFDFRSIYGSILQDWFGVEPAKIQALLFSDYRHIPIIQSCESTTSSAANRLETYQASVFPNPVSNSTQIEFELKESEQLDIKVFNALGAEVDQLGTQTFPSGKHRITWQPTGQKPGNYYIRMVGMRGQKSLPVQVF